MGIIAGWLDGQAKLRWRRLRGISLFLLIPQADVCGSGDDPFRTVEAELECRDRVPLRVCRGASPRAVVDTPPPSNV